VLGWDRRPLIDCDGNFIGMELYSLEEPPYLPRNVVLEVLRSFNARHGNFHIQDDFCMVCKCFFMHHSIEVGEMHLPSQDLRPPFISVPN
jgi:hypothetical protein